MASDGCTAAISYALAGSAVNEVKASAICHATVNFEREHVRTGEQAVVPGTLGQVMLWIDLHPGFTMTGFGDSSSCVGLMVSEIDGSSNLWSKLSVAKRMDMSYFRLAILMPRSFRLPIPG